MTTIAGIDPGKKGGVCVIDAGSRHAVIYPMPTSVDTKKVKACPAGLSAILRQHEINMLYVERVHFISGQGGVSSFTFGESFGMILGVCAALGIETTQVDPSTWKPRMKITSDKMSAVKLAEKLIPTARESRLFYGPRGGILDGPAEAYLIALYGVLHSGIPVRGAFSAEFRDKLG